MLEKLYRLPAGLVHQLRDPEKPGLTVGELRLAKGRKSGSACDEPLLGDLKYVSVSISYHFVAGYVDSKNDPQ